MYSLSHKPKAVYRMASSSYRKELMILLFKRCGVRLVFTFRREFRDEWQMRYSSVVERDSLIKIVFLSKLKNDRPSARLFPAYNNARKIYWYLQDISGHGHDDAAESEISHTVNQGCKIVLNLNPIYNILSLVLKSIPYHQGLQGLLLEIW